MFTSTQHSHAPRYIHVHVILVQVVLGTTVHLTYTIKPNESYILNVHRFTLPYNVYMDYNTLCVISNGSPPLIKIPLTAPIPVPTITAVGVARPSAHGQAINRTAMA